MSTHAAGPSLHLGPTSVQGRRALALLVLSIGAFAVMFVMVASGQRGGDAFADNWLLAGPFLVAAASGVGGALLGVDGVVRCHERGLAVAVPVVFGVLLAVFLAGEVLSPH